MAQRAKKSVGKKKSKTRETKAQSGAKKQMWAVVLFALGLLLGALTFVEGDKLWKALHQFLFGMFGWSVYFLAPLMIYIAVIAALDKPLSSIKAKVWQMGVLIVMISGAIQIFGTGVPGEGTLVDNVVFLYNQGVAKEGGGLCGAVFAVPLMTLFDKIGAAIIIILAIFVFVMLITGSTLISLYHLAAGPVKGLEETYAASRQEQQEAQEKEPKGRRKKSRFNIDVDITGDTEDLPQHPVTSPKEETRPDRNAGFRDTPVEFVTGEAIGALSPEPEQPPAFSHPLAEEIESAGQMEEWDINDIVRRFAGNQEQAPQAVPAVVDEPPAPVRVEELHATASIEPELAVPVQVEYRTPPTDLLSRGRGPAVGDVTEELKNNAENLVSTLQSFGVQTRVVDICRGPAVTRYELQPAAGVKIRKIVGLADDIALNLASGGIRIEAPIPNKAAVGIEIPNKAVSVVHIRELIESNAFADAPSSLTVALGKDIAGNISLADLGKMPHMLIAGATGSGKSVCINSIIISLLYKSSPEDVKLILVDPKVVELGIYNGIPHLLVPVVTDPKKAAGALSWAVGEMLKRYKIFAENAVRDLTGYNKLAAAREELSPMPKIVIIIDELADLMMAAPGDVEDSICRLAQMARAAGMHLVIATQRPSVDVITGVIKANIPSRIAFSVSSQVDSRTILDMGGAEKLLGRGDMLFYPVGASKPQRVQGCFVTDNEVEHVVDFVKQDETALYDQSIADEIDNHVVAEKGGKGGRDAAGDEDELLPQAIECVVEAGQASTSQLQRRLKLGYARAARIIDQLEQKGIVGPFEGAKPRAVLISRDRWIEMKLSGAENAQLSQGGAQTVGAARD